MRRIVLPLAVVALVFGLNARRAPQASSPDPAAAAAAFDASNPDFLDCDDGAEVQQAAEQFVEGGVVSEAWPPHAIGGVLTPIRSVYDPFPTFDGVTLDTTNDKVIFSDENRHSILVYDRTAGDLSNAQTEPAQFIIGPKTQMGYVAGIEVDPERKEFYTVNNDGGDKMVVFRYGESGNLSPVRSLLLPHQSWDVALAPTRDEIAVTVQQSNAINTYKRDAKDRDAPVRIIRGLSTELEDPHGVFVDERHKELITANHGNWTQLRPYTPFDPLVTDVGEYRSGAFHPASITFHSVDANGDVPPLRVIQGSLTGLNWPMGIDADLIHDEIAVANYGDSSVRVFRRGDKGDVQPLRVIRGALTQIVGPVSVAIDAKHDEIWVANYGDHSAVVFPRTATGNVKPKRIVRNAPANTPTCGFTNVSAAAYDTKRDTILVPN
jgi:6-phosphogluconolactonase (cycloisomerase 2 family)